MPIITGTVTPPVDTPPAVPVAEIGYASITYYDPDGVAWPMTDTTRACFALAEGVQGLGASPIELVSDPYPRGGARLRHVQPQPRLITWPIHVEAETHQAFVEVWRAVGKAFTSTSRRRVPGVLEVARPDGTRRQIEVYYRDGFDGLGQHGTGINWDRAVVGLWCEDPYWVDPDPVTERREYSAGAGPFLNPFPTISSGRTLGATTLTNPGDIITYPTWTITGPASLATMTNTDTGDSFALNPSAAAIAHGNLLAGEQVTIRTDPIQVRYQDGSNWTGGLNWPAATLWGLEPGANAVTFQLDGAAAGSAVDVSFTPRYDAA